MQQILLHKTIEYKKANGHTNIYIYIYLLTVNKVVQTITELSDMDHTIKYF